MLDVRRADEHAAARIDGAVNIPLHELPGRRRRGARPARCGCTAPAATAPRSPPRSSTPPAARLVAIDDSFENAEKVGLHLVGARRA